MQQAVFDAIGLSREEADAKFGYLLDALETGEGPDWRRRTAVDCAGLWWPARCARGCALLLGCT